MDVSMKIKIQVANTDSSDVFIYIFTPDIPDPRMYKRAQIAMPVIIKISISGKGAFLDSNP
jgi:hypothetical protein